MMAAHAKNAGTLGVLASALLFTVAFALSLGAGGCSGAGTRGDMPPGWSDDVRPEERAALRVVVFCDDPETGDRVLGLLRIAGYTNEGNYVHPTPNDRFNIKWGGASKEAVDELAAIAAAAVSHRLERLPIFEPGDKDVFLNLPVVGGEALAPAARDDKGKGN
jgi:hypothetical protein